MAGQSTAVGEPVAGRSHLSRALQLLPLGIMAAIVLVTYAAIGWTLRRGFDWTDEAFVYTMIASNRIATDVPLGFQHLLHPLYSLTGESVLVFRVLRLAGYVLLSVALVACARFVLRQLGIRLPRAGWVFILLLAQVGTFLAWSYPPRYLGYNELASWSAQLGVALIVLSLAWGAGRARPAPLSRDQSAARALWLVWAGLGALTIVLAFAKVTSALAFLVILVPALLVPNPYLRLWKRAASLSAGAAALLLLLWAGRVPVGPYFENATRLFFDESARADFGHPVSALISSYGSSLLITGRTVLPSLLVFALLAASLGRKGRIPGRLGPRWNAGISWLLGGLLVAALATLPRVTPWYYLGELVVFIGAAAILGLVALAVGGDVRPGNMRTFFRVAVGATAVLAAPFICAAGTNNMLTGHFLFTATLWAVVLGIALVLMAQRRAPAGSSIWGVPGVPAAIGCMVILMSAFAVKADIAEPYHTVPLLSQTTPTSAPELRGMLLNTIDAPWADWVSATGDSLRAEAFPATATSSAGALFLFNHSGYASPWVGSSQPAAYNSLVTSCTTDPPAGFFVLQPGSAQVNARSLPRLKRGLAKCGISFPGDFRVVATRVSVQLPERAMVVWQLKARVR
jgi:hypothetical protein